MNNYVLSFKEVDKTKLPVVGGKGLNLGELAKINGINVPDGFCVTTEAYKRIAAQIPELNTILTGLSILKTENIEKIRAANAKIRNAIEAVEIPADIVQAVKTQLEGADLNIPYAVRSSATAEDLPTASFAGQHDSFLNILGERSILEHIRKCWASLFTDRAVIYRMQNGFDHSKVHLSVVVQQMAFPESAGIMFTADPVSSNRKIVSIDAGFGLGEALVSGLVDADIYKVRDEIIIDKKVSEKKLGIYALKEGGTEERSLHAEKQNEQALTDEQILNLSRIGRKIEEYFGCPQDIEWCFTNGRFYIVQSRPITTLYPVPEAGGGKNRIYMSLGHQQMMTDCISPLGGSLFKMFFKNLTSQPVREAGGRLFLDVTAELASPMTRKIFIEKGFGSADALIQKALQNICGRTEFMNNLAKGKAGTGLTGSFGSLIGGIGQAIQIYRENNADEIPSFIKRVDLRLKETGQSISATSGGNLLEYIEHDIKDSYKMLVLDNYGLGGLGALMPGIVDKKMKKWLNEDNVSDYLLQSIVCNVTTEMGLDLLDVADAVRDYPAVVEFLKTADDDNFFEKLSRLEGGGEAAKAIKDYLRQYGVRCPGEIDVARPRWAERPAMLSSAILNNVNNFAPGSRSVMVKEKRRAVDAKVAELLERLKKLAGGKSKAKKAAKQMSMIRNFSGFREYPKFAIMQHFFIYKQALLREAENLAKKGVIREAGDIFFLHFEELKEAVALGEFDYGIIAQRKADYETFRKLTPPRVMTSEGEVITAEYDMEDLPEGALCGVPVSSGVIEGRARVILKPEDARMEKGDILVTAFTDPSWTAVFVSIDGLVTEVGGMMTHGAIVAREYGIPAVVSVENATKLIKDGQMIRINGSKGFVEILGGCKP